MTRLTKLVLSVVLVCGLHGSVSGKSWRGLTPLHSTKKDVVRLFRQCSDSDQYCVLKLKNEHAFIVFSNNLISSPERCGSNLAADTILSITVSPKSLRVKDLKLSPRLYKSLGPSPWGYIYLNEIEGVIISEQKGRVAQLCYVPISDERGQCPVYYSELTDFVSLDPHGPMLSVNCPPHQIAEGKVVIFSASSVDNPKIWFSWTVIGGSIIEGQRSDKIKVSTEGLVGQRITATVAMRILGDVHVQESSCEIDVISRHP
jgi:hypothetical protein